MNIYADYAKVFGEPPKREVPDGFVNKILFKIRQKAFRPNKTHDYCLRAKSAWRSVSKTQNVFLDEFTNHLKENPQDVSESRLFTSKPLNTHILNSYFYVYRTPLELAIERDAPIEVIMKLLEHGAEPTNTACSITMLMACKGWQEDCEKRRKDKDVKKIIELLSFAGADWSKPCAPFCIKYQDNHPSINIDVPLADFIVEKLGVKEAHSLGVSATPTTPHEIDFDRFSENVKLHRLKRMQKENINIDGVDNNQDIEISIPSTKKQYWTKG